VLYKPYARELNEPKFEPKRTLKKKKVGGAWENARRCHRRRGTEIVLLACGGDITQKSNQEPVPNGTVTEEPGRSRSTQKRPAQHRGVHRGKNFPSVVNRWNMQNRCEEKIIRTSAEQNMGLERKGTPLSHMQASSTNKRQELTRGVVTTKTRGAPKIQQGQRAEKNGRWVSIREIRAKKTASREKKKKAVEKGVENKSEKHRMA